MNDSTLVTPRSSHDPSSLRALCLAAAALLVGCGSAPSTACDFSQTVGAETVHACIEFNDLSDAEIAQADASCAQQNNPPFVAAVVDSCPTSNVLGICTLTNGGISAEELFYKSPSLTVEIARKACTDGGGTWSDG